MTGENERDEKEPAPAERRPTRGERIRKEREAKAQAKVERRGREAEQREDRAIEIAEQARDATREMVRENGAKVAIALLSVLVLVVGIAIVRDMMAGADEEAARALAEADAAAAPSDRAEKLAAIAEEQGAGELATWARLGEAAAQLEAGDPDAASASYEALVGSDLAVLEQRLALEGLAAARLAKGDRAGATEALERLAKSDDVDSKNAAELGLARLLASEGKRAEAKALLDGVVSRLNEAGRRGRGFTYEEAEALTAALQDG